MIGRLAGYCEKLSVISHDYWKTDFWMTPTRDYLETLHRSFVRVVSDVKQGFTEACLPSARSTGTARRVKQDRGGMIDHCGVHLASAAILSNQPGPPQCPSLHKQIPRE